jgi:hypothetical protein
MYNIQLSYIFIPHIYLHGVYKVKTFFLLPRRPRLSMVQRR